MTNATQSRAGAPDGDGVVRAHVDADGGDRSGAGVGDPEGAR